MRRNEDHLPVRRGPDFTRPQMSSGNPLSPAGFFTASPWQTMRRMQEDMDRLFGQFFNDEPGGGLPTSLQQWKPSVDISQDAKEWCIEAELPGVSKDDIEVQIQDHHLILRAELCQEPKEETANQGREYHHRERRYGFFERVLPLPENVNEEQVACDFKNGVLTLHLPKMEQAMQSGRRIPITTGEQTAAGKTDTGHMTGEAKGSQSAHTSGETKGSQSTQATGEAKAPQSGQMTGQAKAPQSAEKKAA